MNKFVENYFFILFSFIPVAIIIGPAVSLTNILLISISFLIYMALKNNWSWLFQPSIKLLFLLYLYLIFNSLISLDSTAGVYRNFGFIRFIICFYHIN